MFKEVDDLDKATQLHEAGLLWYKCPVEGIRDWKHPLPWWRAPEHAMLLHTKYAVLLED